MFLKFVNFASNVFILSCNFSTSAPLGPETLRLTTQDLDLQVQTEISVVRRILDDSKEIDMKKRGQLVGFIEALAQRAILAERKADAILLNQGHDQGALETEKKMLEQQLNSFIFPLTVAFWGVKIETQCRDVDFSTPSEEIKGLKPLEKNSIQRRYKWIAILTTQANEKYVKSIVEEMKNHFRLKHGIQKDIDPQTDATWKDEYGKFVNRFAGAVVVAIEYRNHLVHNEFAFARGKIDALQKFNKEDDEYLTVFYNSLLGHMNAEMPATITPNP